MKIIQFRSLVMFVSIVVFSVAGHINAGTKLSSGSAFGHLLLVSGGNDKMKPLLVDRSDSEAVAKAFVTAIANKNVQEAMQYVIPEERIEFSKELKKGVPRLPQKPEIEVRVKKGGVRADVVITNSKPVRPGSPPFGLDMKLIDGKWWIVK